jgi:hypothetical protein
VQIFLLLVASSVQNNFGVSFGITQISFIALGTSVPLYTMLLCDVGVSIIAFNIASGDPHTNNGPLWCFISTSADIDVECFGSSVV